jgi:hypothetical protein
MPFTANVTIKGIERVKLQLSPQQFRHAVTMMLVEASHIAWTRAKNKAPGHVAASITQAPVYELTARVYSLLPEAKYTDTGRKPGGPLPPPHALEAWMAKHGFHGSSFVLARAIAQRGIRGRFFMRAARGAVRSARNRLAKRFEETWKL